MMIKEDVPDLIGSYQIKQKGPIAQSALEGNYDILSLPKSSPMRIWLSIGMVDRQLEKRPIKEVVHELIVIESDKRWSDYIEGDWIG